MVEESDVLACGGYLPERYVGGAGDGEVETAGGGTDEVLNRETASLDTEQAGTGEAGTNAGGVGEVAQEERSDAGDRGCDEGGGGSTVADREPRSPPPVAAPAPRRWRNAGAERTQFL